MRRGILWGLPLLSCASLDHATHTGGGVHFSKYRRCPRSNRSRYTFLNDEEPFSRSTTYRVIAPHDMYTAPGEKSES
jgi:hypothetical protein